MEKSRAKMAILFLLIVFLIFCDDDKIELSNINFPKKIESLLKKTSYKVNNSIYEAGLLAYEVKQFDDYKFFDEDFDGEIVPNSATYSGKNYLQFVGNQEDINGFQIHIWTKNESEKLLKTLLKNLGEPSFENDNDFERYFIWEIPGKIFILRQGYDALIQNKKTIESDLLS